jgi:general secretion pathway protein L
LAVDRAWAGPTTVLVPSEDVLTLTVDLPFPTRAQRLQNLPYAMEDAVAEPLASLHFALGQEVAPRRHIAGVVRRARMDQWIALLAGEDLDAAILLPDALTLPIPPAGVWAVRKAEGGRALIRTDNGAGFAVPLAMLDSAWKAAGQPRIAAIGDPLPDAMAEGVDATAAMVDPAGDPLMVLPPLDLRQGPYAATRPTAASAGRILALVAGIGIVVHMAILGVDALLLHGMAEKKEAEARAVLQAVAPQVAATDDPVAAADRLLGGAGAGGRPFTGLLSRTSQALPGAGVVAFNRVAYQPGGLDMAVVVPDASTLDRAVQSLNASGLTATGTPGVADVAASAGGLNATLTVAGAGR